MMFRPFLLLVVAFGASPLHARDYLVRTQSEYSDASKKVKAGDTITLANGTWRDFEITLSAKGTAKKPITLRSKNPGKVIISGQSNLRIGGQHIIVSGLVFRDGFSPTGEVISFRRSKKDLAFNSRVTEVVIDRFNKPDRFESDYWVSMYGKHNRFDHNHMAGKSNKGVTFAVRLTSEESQQNHHRIDHNYFGPRPTLGSNGGETLRIGTSHYADKDSNTLVENNYFDRTDGEVEIISSKSGKNILRGNVFFQSSGTLTLRHGDGNLVEENVFMGGGKDHTGGIRVINRHQTVRNNYMEGLRGDGFASALTVMNGVPNSPANRYVEVDNATIENNSVVDSSRITFGAGADAERSAAPLNSRFTNNLLGGSGGDATFVKIQSDTGGIKFAGNLLLSGKADQLITGVAQKPMKLERAKNGLLYAKGSNAGAPRSLNPITREQVGVSWYAKPAAENRFAAGKPVNVLPGDGTLFKALVSAAEGDRLTLSAGEYIVNKTLPLDKAISIEGPKKEVATITFGRPSLVELKEGGSLRLANLTIDGVSAPDSVGNAVIRTTIYPIQSNFVIEMDGVTVKNLSVNKSFDVIKLGKSTFADRVMIRDSKFEDISGSLLLAAAESEDYGQYNAEYVDIARTKFKNIGGPIVNLYRGGRDESTFGPHFTLVKSTLENVGKSGNNASGASLLLHGVQYTEVSENQISGTAPFQVKHTVGRPQTRIAKNSFVSTPEIQVSELNYKGGKQRAVLVDNEFDEGAAK